MFFSVSLRVSWRKFVPILSLDLKNLQLPTSSLGLHSGPQGKISETASLAPQTVLSTDPTTGLPETQSCLTKSPSKSNAWEKTRPDWEVQEASVGYPGQIKSSRRKQEVGGEYRRSQKTKHPFQLL